jgi:hypothetical protein
MKTLITIFLISVAINAYFIHKTWQSVRSGADTLWERTTEKANDLISTHPKSDVYPDKLENYNGIAFNPALGEPIKQPTTDSAIQSLEKAEADRWQAGDPERKWLLVKIGPDGKEYYVANDAGPSGDPHLEFYTKSDKPNAQGSTLIYQGSTADGATISGNGFIYTTSRMNEFFTVTRKYQADANGKITEVVQPFLYAGIDSKALKPVTLYSEDGKKTVANVAAGSPVEIVLMQENLYQSKPDRFLIRTQNNILGWVTSEQISANEQCSADGTALPDSGSTFREICYMGD